MQSDKPESLSSVEAAAGTSRQENTRKGSRDIPLDLFEEVSPLPDRPERRGDGPMDSPGFPIWLGSALSTAVVLGLTLWFVRSYHRENIEQPLQMLRDKPAQLPANLTQTLADTSALATTNAAELVTIRSRLNTMAQELTALRAELNARPAPAPPQPPPPVVDVDAKLRTALEPLAHRLETLDTLVRQTSQQLAALTAQAKAETTTSPPPKHLPASPADELTDELILLKERNRLTLLADEVMATGKSEAMRRLWIALREPALDQLKHAAAAEITRVQNHLDGITRLPPGYRIDVKKTFPKSTAATDDKLETAHLAALLLDPQQPLPTRARAAVLLTGRRTQEAGEALMKALRNDEDLDVVKECQHALRHTFGMTVPLFDVQSAEAWWSAHRTAALKSPQTPATAPPAPAPAPGG